ncbi:ATPase family protein [Acanthamoeba castellanii str. Neff]|uniref:ATPase family protein n=1 Tax=Acanthamoeba castellanii (strain ATCC 30010 / Neff) TaxID=1257118 RepID=L8HHB9_ACACF|nr:ATPase family protein [Acanthamoeba castellanii str. Neff]ELR24984.1 ATPase family protein [Acanthamoeba castellanii str. Neff]
MHHRTAVTRREAEYVALSADTTEGDLKQRREIINGSVQHLDQPPVIAATQGRILILEGLEKCERNVLPVLNNLLENREMSLEDGRMLISADRYDKLKKTHSKEDFRRLGLVKVHPNFRVIALGLPVPKYPGSALDPPLRSRFQAREISGYSIGVQYAALRSFVPDMTTNLLRRLLSAVEALHGVMGIPHMGESGVISIATLLSHFPNIDLGKCLPRVYPYRLLMEKEDQETIEVALQRFGLVQQTIQPPTDKKQAPIDYDESYELVSVRSVGPADALATAQLKFRHKLTGQTVDVAAPVGKHVGLEQRHRGFVLTPYNDYLVTSMIQDHAINRDICIVGEKGMGKTALVKEFAERLGYASNIQIVNCYKDMTSRDLLQRRITKPNGAHRLPATTLSMLQRLVSDREITLFDGTRLVRVDRYQRMVKVLLEQKTKSSGAENHEGDDEADDEESEMERRMGVDRLRETEEATTGDAWDQAKVERELKRRKIVPISPAFRIVVLANPPTLKQGVNWLTSEVITLFHFHHLALNDAAFFDQKADILRTLFRDHPRGLEVLEKTLRFDIALHGNKIGGVPNCLSLRQLIRTVRLSRGLLANVHNDLSDALKVELIKSDGREVVRIGDVTAEVEQPELADRMLELLGKEREYMQLHRDTTVQSLTSAPSLADGRIVWMDSPLVRAVVHGRVLVLDEADKAPLEVVCVLKGLIEDRYMLLADGRRIMGEKATAMEDDVVLVHPKFRVIALANRPGYPFLGNDFYREIGDCFSWYGHSIAAAPRTIVIVECLTLHNVLVTSHSHAIDNPDTASELALLQSYGPDVNSDILQRLTRLFNDLRQSVDEVRHRQHYGRSGQLSYPYSTRELVNLIRHLQHYPKDSLLQILENVFSFDIFNPQLREHLAQTFHRHGIPLGIMDKSLFKINVGGITPLPPSVPHEQWTVLGNGKAHYLEVEATKLPLKVSKGWSWPPPHMLELRGRTEARVHSFTEAKYSWSIVTPGMPIAMVSGKKGELHVLVDHPFGIHSYNGNHSAYSITPLGDNMPFFSPSSTNPKLAYLPLTDRLVVFLPSHNVLLLVDTNRRETVPINIPVPGSQQFSLFGNKLYLSSQRPQRPAVLTMSDALVLAAGVDDGPDATAGREVLVLHQKEGRLLLFVDLGDMSVHRYFMPHHFKLNRVFLPSRDVVIVEGAGGQRDHLFIGRWPLAASSAGAAAAQQRWAPLLRSPLAATAATLHRPAAAPSFPAAPSTFPTQFDFMSTEAQPNSCMTFLSSADPHRPMAAYADFVDTSASPLLLARGDIGGGATLAVHSFPRPSATAFVGDETAATTTVTVNERALYLRRSRQLLSLSRRRSLKGADTGEPDDGVLEVLNLETASVRSIPLSHVHLLGLDPKQKDDLRLKKRLSRPDHPMARFRGSMNEVLSLCELTNGEVALLWEDGTVAVLEVDPPAIEDSLQRWKSIVGLSQSAVNEDGSSSLEIEYEHNGKEAEGPKHGKIDPENTPHVGGNTWAGGSGGRDTAGLGGKGGAYRSDSGHEVHQLTEAEKESVSAEVKAAAKEMAKKALEKKLKEIDMTEGDLQLYSNYLQAVSQQVSQLRVILAAVDAKAKERQWLKLKTSGDLDDMRLVEGITGEKTIYKHRGEHDPTPGGPQEKPKRLVFAFDVSASMYRFNQADRRLERMLETVVMIMESFKGFEHKYSYAIVGHAGDGPEVPFVEFGKPPKNENEALKVLRRMHAHTEYCPSGDSTVEALEVAIDRVLAEEGDDYFVFLLSDANLGRYGIPPKEIGKLITGATEKKVNSYVIFIASFHDEADRWRRDLPVGRSYLCLDTAKLPYIMKQIFTTNLMP